MDCAGALVALPPALPLMLIVGLLVYADLGRPVLFRQVRVGKDGKLFNMAKFRTMRDTRDSAGRLLPDEERVSAVGRMLRRFRLDEFPELVAILAGRMSFVGPRPLPPDILAGIPRSAERTVVRPGLTGLAQVSGNTLLTNPEKIALDLYYTRVWTLWLDLRILVRTAGMVITGDRRDEAMIARALAAFAAPEDPKLAPAPARPEPGQR